MTNEQLATRVTELEDTVRQLEKENNQLRRAAFDFGALAERLNSTLIVERLAYQQSPPQIRLRLLFGRFVDQFVRFRAAPSPAGRLERGSRLTSTQLGAPD